MARRTRTKIANSSQAEQAGLYVRVSLDRAAHGMQDEILSPETQEDRARQYCGAQGWAVTTVERDIDESAYRQHYSQREGLMRLLEAVERGELTKVVVWKFSRLSRRLKEFIELCDRIEAAGGGVVSVTEQVDTSTSAGRLIRNILASFAQFQSEELSEQIFEAWMTKAKRGERPGGLAPFGTINEKGLLVRDPDTHHHLVAIYRTYRDTGNLKAVWDYLVGQGVPSPRAAEWNLNTIRGILTNPVYIGRLDWAGETFQGRWEPLVPEELWQEVQERIAARRGTPATRHDARLLTGFLRCAQCGRPMWTRYAKRSANSQSFLSRVYWCCSPQTQRRGCLVPALDGGEADSVVWTTVQQLLAAHSVEQLWASAARVDDPGKSGDDQRRRRQLLAEKDRTEQQAAQLFDLLGAGDITREQFRTQNLRYLDRLQQIRTELTRLSSVPAGPDPETIRRAAQFAPVASTDEERRLILSDLSVRVEAGAKGVYLHLVGLRISLRPRLVGQTWHFGEQYHRLDYQGTMLTDKQVAFIRRTYHWADKRKVAAKLGRQYSTLVFLAAKLRQRGVLAPIIKSVSR